MEEDNFNKKYVDFLEGKITAQEMDLVAKENMQKRINCAIKFFGKRELSKREFESTASIMMRKYPALRNNVLEEIKHEKQHAAIWEVNGYEVVFMWLKWENNIMAANFPKNMSYDDLPKGELLALKIKVTEAPNTLSDGDKQKLGVLKLLQKTHILKEKI